MFRLMGFLLKAAFVTALVLVLGQVVRWEGRTVSDQIKTRLAKAEKSPLVGRLSGWAERWMETPDGARLVSPRGERLDDRRVSSRRGPRPEATGREIPPSERQKLRELIRELNGRP